MAAAVGGTVSPQTVLHVISGLGVGGAETSLAQIVSALQARGMPQYVVCIGTLDDHADELRSRGVTVTVLGVKGVAHLPAGAIYLTRLVRRLDPAVVQGWMYHGNILATLAHLLAGQRSRRRLYW